MKINLEIINKEEQGSNSNLQSEKVKREKQALLLKKNIKIQKQNIIVVKKI